MKNSEFQVLRWGIPGWITIATYFILYLSINNYDIFEIANLNGINFVGLTALLAAIGVPLGYIVYQIYFYFKWKFMRKGKISRYLKGAELYEKLKTKNNENAWYIAESAFDTYLTLFLPENVRYEDIIRRYESFKSRTDRVHGLGATLWGMVLSLFIFCTLHCFAFHIMIHRNITFLFTVAFIIIIWCILYRNYCKMNRNTFRQMRDMLNIADRLRY